MKETIKPIKKKIIETFLLDTSVIVKKRISKLASKGFLGIILIPNAAMAELENLANRGRDEGFDGLEEIAKLHKYKGIKIKFVGPRPSEHQIKFAKSGEIDALIRGLAHKYKATLITSDMVQGKSAKAYGIEVFFIRQKYIQPAKKKFALFKKKPPVKKKKTRRI